MTYSAKELARSGVPEERTRLRAYRRAIKRTAAEVAELAGVSMQTVLVFERGQPVRHEKRIAAAYGRLRPSKDYGAELRAFREVKGLTQAAAADLAGISPASWSQIERRGHSIAPQAVMRATLDEVLPARPLAPVITSVAVGKERTRNKTRRARLMAAGVCVSCKSTQAIDRKWCNRCRTADSERKRSRRASARRADA